MRDSLLRFSVLLLLLFSLLFCPAGAEDGSLDPQRPLEDSLTWEFSPDTGLLSLHGTGPMRSYWDAYPEWDMFSEQITAVSLDEGITSVGDCAFYDCRNLQSVHLPDSVQVVDRYAFYYCWKLQSITIPQNLRYVGEYAFYNTSLHTPEDIAFPEGTEFIGANAFHSALKTGGRYVLPASVQYIGPCALSNGSVSDVLVSKENSWYQSQNHALLTKDGSCLLFYAPDAPENHYAVPEGVQRICEEAFNVPQHLETLSLPGSVRFIEDAAIFTTFRLREIIVASDNPAYRVIDGALCTADGKTCLAFPDGIPCTQITIPEGVERLAPFVFYGRREETLSVSLPDSLKEIGTMSLPLQISTLTLPEGLQRIGSQVFLYPGCADTVRFDGSEAQWRAIEIGEGNDGLTTATIQYAK